MKHTIKFSALAIITLIGLAIVRPAVAQTAEERGLAIAQEADQRDLGWGDTESVMRMVLKNRNAAFEVNEEGEGDKSLITFDAPRDVAGTSLLSHTRILEPDDQWLFLPALKRVKRISSANKSGAFVGSEFAYEDLVSQEVGKYTYRFLREESCGDLNCYVVERYPLYENSGYTRQIVYWDANEYRIQRIDFYDRKDALLKTLTYHNYQQYAEQYWRADRMSMSNRQNGKHTDLIFEEWSFGTGASEGDFTPSRLRRSI
jgi:outer membrane lipoprotein-sorting protein